LGRKRKKEGGKIQKKSLLKKLFEETKLTQVYWGKRIKGEVPIRDIVLSEERAQTT